MNKPVGLDIAKLSLFHETKQFNFPEKNDRVRLAWRGFLTILQSFCFTLSLFIYSSFLVLMPLFFSNTVLNTTFISPFKHVYNFSYI